MGKQHEPRKISTAEKYRILGLLSDSQRRLIALVIANSACGCWTSYQDAREASVISPEKRMSEILNIKGIDLKTRQVKRKSCDGRMVMFCEVAV